MHGILDFFFFLWEFYVIKQKEPNMYLNSPVKSWLQEGLLPDTQLWQISEALEASALSP